MPCLGRSDAGLYCGTMDVSLTDQTHLDFELKCHYLVCQATVGFFFLVVVFKSTELIKQVSISVTNLLYEIIKKHTILFD